MNKRTKEKEDEEEGEEIENKIKPNTALETSAIVFKCLQIAHMD